TSARSRCANPACPPPARGPRNHAGAPRRLAGTGVASPLHLEKPAMMPRTPGRTAVLLLLLLAPPAPAQQKAYSIKAVNEPAPKGLDEAFRKLLGERCVRLLDAKGNALVEVWFRKEVPVKATAAQAQKGLTYRQVPETTLFGVMRVV